MTVRALIKSAEKRVRAGRVQMLACLRELAVTRTALHLPRNEICTLPSSPPAGVIVKAVDAAQSFSRRLPRMPGEAGAHWIFLKEQHGILPETFVAEFARGRFWGYYGGSVFTEDGQLVPALSKDVWGETLHSALVRARLPKPQRLPGRTLSLVTPEATRNYHHWMVDLLPRAGLAVRAGYSLGEFDHVLIKDHALPFQLEGLRRLGIDESKIIRVTDAMHLQADTLVVPSLHLDNTRVGSADLLFTRQLFNPAKPPASRARRRLYISRRDAAFRHVTNEAALQPVLKDYGFEEVSMSGLTVAQQAELFAEADAVLAPDGAALANLLFAPPGCKVIELFAPGWVVPYFWMICEANNLDYTAIIGAGPRPPEGTLPREIKQDIVLDLDQLRVALEPLRVTG